jgi:hypothetical protein
MIAGASAEGMVMLVIQALDGATVERAGALVACEQAAARQVRPELPAAFNSPDVCTAALPRLSEALSNLGFGRRSAYGIQPAAPRRGSSAQWVSVDFDTANPLSRPFWLHAGFRPAGYGVLRLIDGGPAGQPGSAGGH